MQLDIIMAIKPYKEHEMKVNHWIETSEEEATPLYMLAVTTASKTYATPEEHNAAVLEEMPMFKTALDALVSEAYKLGKEEHMMHHMAHKV